MKFFIYALSDPRSGAIRYVGKTDNLKRRLKSHMNNAGSTHVARWIQSLKKAGVSPVMKVLETIYDPEELYWQQCERLWIKVLSENGCNLTNLDSGGNSGKKASAETRSKQSAAAKQRVVSLETRQKLSVLGRNMSAETRAKISASLRVRPQSIRDAAALKMRGKKRSAETLARMSAAKSGVVFSEIHKQKLSESHKGNLQPAAVREKISKSMKELRRKQREQRSTQQTQITAE